MKNSRFNLIAIGSMIALLSVPLTSRANPDVEDIKDVVSYTGEAGSYLAARIAASDNDDQAAVIFLQKTLQLDPDNEQLKRNLFLALLANGRVEEAVVLAVDIKAENTSDQIVKLVSGVELIRERSWAKAIDVLSGENISDLDNLAMNILVAWAKHGNDQTAEGLKQIDAIEGAEWMDIIKFLHRGLMLSASGNDAGAVEMLQKAINIRGAAWLLTETYIDAIDALSRAQQRLGKLEEARATIDGGLKIFPNLSLLHEMKDNLDSGKPAGLLAANPRQGAAEFFYNIGNVMNRRNGASLALIYLQQQQAREFFYNLRNVGRSDGETPMAQIFLQLGKHLYPESARLSISLGSVFEKQDNAERANAYYAQISEDSPYKRQGQLETAINLDSMDEVQAATAILQALIDDKPGDLSPYMTLGRLLNKRERYREAAVIFNQAIAQITDPQPRHWDYFYRRAISYERLKEWDKAEASFKKSIELDPNRAVVLNYLGYSWVDKGINLDEGLEMIKKAVQLRPNEGFIADSLGWAYYRLSRFQDAVNELERASELMPDDAVVNDHLGDAYWRTGRKLEATFKWQHAIDAKPESAEEVKIRQKLKTGLPDVPDKPLAKTE